MGAKTLSAKQILLAALTACMMFFMQAAAARADGPISATAMTAPYALMVAADSKDNDRLGSGAQSFVDGMARRALDFLANNSMSQDQKKSEFGRLLTDNFDMDTIGRFSLGRYWRSSTPEQRREYIRLFRRMVIAVYSERFQEYKGQKFETRSHRQDGERDTIVTSFIIPDEGSEVQVDWRVRYKDSRYKIIDVIVEGVSMSVTQRSDFASVIQRGGGDIQVLINHLKESG